MTEGLTPHEAAIFALLVAEVERGNAAPLSPDYRRMYLHPADLDAIMKARAKGAVVPALSRGTQSWPLVADSRFESPRLLEPPPIKAMRIES